MMKICWVSENIDIHSGEILQGLRETVATHFWEGESDPVFSLAYDREDQFFFKNVRGILWARVYFQPVTSSDLAALNQEMARLKLTFRQSIRAVVFMPRSEENAEGRLDFPAILVEYFLFKSEGRLSLGISKRGDAPEASREGALMEPPASTPRQRSDMPNARLTREELSELIHLSLELKRP